MKFFIFLLLFKMSLLPDLRTTDFSHIDDRLINRRLKKQLEKYPVIAPKETMKEKLAKKFAEKNAKNEK